MSLDFIENYYVPVVMAACLVIGYCIKHISWLSKVSNEYIPAILSMLGAVFACVNAGAVSFSTIVAGAVTGLASTGLYEAFAQIIEKQKR